MAWIAVAVKQTNDFYVAINNRKETVLVQAEKLFVLRILDFRLCLGIERFVLGAASFQAYEFLSMPVEDLCIILGEMLPYILFVQ